MFYAHIVLAKKGPLARIWLAAHWDKKLTKAHVFETNIEKSVEGIMQPKVKLALRTSGHLLLGVVRIYSRKAKYLLADCNEAFIKIKMAFRPGIVDLPEGHREANINTITLPEVFHDFDTALPELNDIDIEAQFSINQSRADEITMREDYGSLSLSLHDDGFGDLAFDADTPDLARNCIDPNVDEHLFAEEVCKNNGEVKTQSAITEDPSEDVSDVDGFGDEFGQPDVGLFEGDMFGEIAGVEETSLHNEDKTEEDDQGNKITLSKCVSDHDRVCESLKTAIEIQKSPEYIEDAFNETKEINSERIFDDKAYISNDKPHVPKDGHISQIQNEEESFALAPVDASAYKGITKAKRKRKLIVDDIKNISGEEMKAQLSNTSDIITTLDLAPPTKRLMYWKETGGVEKLFSLPSRDIPARGLFLNYHRHLISNVGLLEDFSILGPLDVLALDQIQQNFVSSPHAPNKRGRKRKNDLSILTQCVSTVSSSFALETSISEQTEPDAVRNNDTQAHAHLTCHSFENSRILEPQTEVDAFELLQSSDAMYSIPQLEPMAPIESVPTTPGNSHNDIDIQDDFHPSGLTLHHSGIENIESIPNLPVDQVSSILNEAENMVANLEGNTFNINRLDNAALSTSDWNEYEFPQSVEIQSFDQQQENETDEQFEERVLNKRAAQMFISVRNLLQRQNSISLCGITRENSRKQAAQKFYSLLVLKKFRTLNITQTDPYADIIITKGQAFENPKL